MVEVRRDRGEGRGGDSDQAGPSRKRRRSHGEDDAGEEPEARRRKKKPLPRRRQIREHLLVRHWRDEGCDTCVSQGIECVPPKADSKQEKCDDCAARSNECSGRWITKQENVSKMHNLLTGRKPLQIDDEWVEAEIKTFGNYLGGPWDKCQEYPAALASPRSRASASLQQASPSFSPQRSRPEATRPQEEAPQPPPPMSPSPSSTPALGRSMPPSAPAPSTEASALSQSEREELQWYREMYAGSFLVVPTPRETRSGTRRHM